VLVGPSGKPVASVVVPAYKSKATIVGCLDALVRQEGDPAYEVIVVESSGDGAGDLVRARFPGVRVIESGERLFAGRARNRGAEEASGELLLFIDSDCIAEPLWLEKMHRAHRERECAGVAGSILNANPESPISVSSYMTEMSDFYPCGRPAYRKFLCSGNVSYKAEVFRKHGGFDSRVALYEDVELTKRMYRAGEKLLFDPDIRVSHFHRTGFREYYAYEFRRGRGGAIARRNGALMGASWVKYPPLGFLAAPGLLLRKGTVFPCRMLRAYPGDSLRMIRALPYFYAALLVWVSGFLYEVVTGRESAKCRTDSDIKW